MLTDSSKDNAKCRGKSQTPGVKAANCSGIIILKNGDPEEPNWYGEHYISNSKDYLSG